jgi:hypothetical protein
MTAARIVFVRTHRSLTPEREALVPSLVTSRWSWMA